MARPLKDGVDYFPLDTDFLQDDKVRLIKSEFGAKGILILIALFSEIYRGDGYFKVWNNDCCLLMADAVGCGVVPENITQVVQGCLRRSIFDDGVFQMFGILTSAGIQRRYIRMFPSRKQIFIVKEYWLLDGSDEKDVPASILNKLTFKSLKNDFMPNKNNGNPDKTGFKPQSKVKEIKGKEKENKEDIMSETAETAPDRQQIFFLPLNDGSEFPIYQDQVSRWAELYPAVDIMQALRNMKGWLEANPKRRKTKNGILRFTVNWLSSDQDKGGTRNGRKNDQHGGNVSEASERPDKLGIQL